MWMESSKERRCSGTATGASTLFPNCVCGCPKGLLDAENFGKLFLTFFQQFLQESHISEARDSNRSNAATRYRCALKVTIHFAQDGVEIRSRACLRAGTSRLKIQGARPISFREQL